MDYLTSFDILTIWPTAPSFGISYTLFSSKIFSMLFDLHWYSPIMLSIWMFSLRSSSTVYFNWLISLFDSAGVLSSQFSVTRGTEMSSRMSLFFWGSKFLLMVWLVSSKKDVMQFLNICNFSSSMLISSSFFLKSMFSWVNVLFFSWRFAKSIDCAWMSLYCASSSLTKEFSDSDTISLRVGREISYPSFSLNFLMISSKFGLKSYSSMRGL